MELRAPDRTSFPKAKRERDRMMRLLDREVAGN